MPSAVWGKAAAGRAGQARLPRARQCVVQGSWLAAGGAGQLVTRQCGTYSYSIEDRSGGSSTPSLSPLLPLPNTPLPLSTSRMCQPRRCGARARTGRGRGRRARLNTLEKFINLFARVRAGGRGRRARGAGRLERGAAAAAGLRPGAVDSLVGSAAEPSQPRSRGGPGRMRRVDVSGARHSVIRGVIAADDVAHTRVSRVSCGRAAAAGPAETVLRRAP